MNELQARLDRLFEKDIAGQIGKLADILNERANDSESRPQAGNYQIAASYLEKAIMMLLGDLVQPGDE